jgi:hypothetical protein
MQNNTNIGKYNFIYFFVLITNNSKSLTILQTIAEVFQFVYNIVIR